jgi:hypothetical protein
MPTIPKKSVGLVKPVAVEPEVPEVEETEEVEVEPSNLDIQAFTISGKVTYQYAPYQMGEMVYQLVVNNNGSDVQSQMTEAQNVVVANLAANFKGLTLSMTDDGLLQIDASSFPVTTTPQKAAGASPVQGTAQNRFAAPRTPQGSQGGNTFQKKAPTNWDAVGAEFQAGTATLFESGQYGPYMKTQGQGNVKVADKEGKIIVPRSFFENYMADFEFGQEFSDKYLSQL